MKHQFLTSLPCLIIVITLVCGCKPRGSEDGASLLKDSSVWTAKKVEEEFHLRGQDIVDQLRNLPEVKQKIFLKSTAPFRTKIPVDVADGCSYDTVDGKPVVPDPETFANFLCRFAGVIKRVKIEADFKPLFNVFYEVDKQGKRRLIQRKKADAIYYWLTNTITVDIGSWKYRGQTSEERTIRDRMLHYLVFHEYLRALGKNDD